MLWLLRLFGLLLKTLASAGLSLVKKAMLVSKLVAWTLYRDAPWKALISFNVRARSTRETILKELHSACVEQCLAFTH